jgi:hypothetical protein
VPIDERPTAAEIRINILQFFALSNEDQCAYLPKEMIEHHLENLGGHFSTDDPIDVMIMRLDDYISLDMYEEPWVQFYAELHQLNRYFYYSCAVWQSEGWQSGKEWQEIREKSRALLLNMGFEVAYPKIPFENFLYYL